MRLCTGGQADAVSCPEFDAAAAEHAVARLGPGFLTVKLLDDDVQLTLQDVNLTFRQLLLTLPQRLLLILLLQCSSS